MSKDEIEIAELEAPKFPWWVIVVIAIAWLANLGWGIWAMKNDRTLGGQWGDIFGAVNALFSGLAFVLIYHGIQTQQHEMKIAKTELSEAKKQTISQKIALDKQNEATDRQMLDSSFFSLLSELDKLLHLTKLSVSELQLLELLKNEGVVYTDEYVPIDWQWKYFLVVRSIESKLHALGLKQTKMSKDTILRELKTYILHSEGINFLIVVNAIYSILRRVMNFEQRKMLADIFQANLTYDQKQLIFYSAATLEYEFINMANLKLTNIGYAHCNHQYGFEFDFIRDILSEMDCE